MKLQTKFILNLGFSVLVALSVFALFLRSSLVTLQETEIQERLNTHLSLSSAYLDDLFLNVEGSLDLISNDSLVRQYFLAGEIERYQLFHSELIRSLRRYLKHRDNYAEISVVLPDGFIEAYANNGDSKISEEDAFLTLALASPLTRANDITYAVEEYDEGKFYLVAYREILKNSDLVWTEENAIIGYIKISIDLTKFTAKASSEDTLTSIVYKNTRIFSEAKAVATQTFGNDKNMQNIDTQTIKVFEGLNLESSTNTQAFKAKNTSILTSNILLFLLMMFSLLAFTIVLLKLVILRPIQQFSDLVDRSDFETLNQPILKDYKNNEFGRLTQRFDELMKRITRSSRDLKRQAFTDTLTGLPNRAALYAFLEKQTKNMQQPFSVLFLDLDGFKQVNDIYGHELGDQLLIAVGKKLSEEVRGDHDGFLDCLDIRRDAVIRLGGDEFTIVLMGDDIDIVADRIIHSFQAGIVVEGKTLYTGTSIGIAKFPQHSTDPALLIQYADLAMYRAKAEGKMRFCYFSKALAEQEKQRLLIEETVREGIEFDRFETHFQAKVDTENNSIVGFEALARLKDSNGKMVSPAQFIPIARENGVLEYITYRVTEQTCQMLQTIGEENLVASINISPSQLNDLRLVADIRSIMWTYGVTPSQIEFEVTEEEIITNFAGTRRNLELLRRFGFKTALDDFGSGYSSLGQLKKFQFDTLKLDRIFVSTEDYNTEAASGILNSIKSLSDTLSMTIVAEGIETEEQLEFVKSFGIHLIQGFYCARPMPSCQFLEFYQNPPKSIG